MKILSLFDGISCGRKALERMGIPIYRYYTSEIDKYASAISRYNYPDNIELGDIIKITKEQVQELEIDMIIGGSPCTNLSIGNKERTGLDGERSRLFYNFVEILRWCQEINPSVLFLFENVLITQENLAMTDNPDYIL